tara:strand:+ start:636 stop:1361 length:726 start_codon:yes stop_codon:yes gene_type:complete
MKTILPIILLSLFTSVVISDNEIFIDQSGATANIDVEQLGGSNLIGGSTASAGSMTALDLDGTSMTLDINQIGSSNIFRGDIWADSYTGFFNFTGSSNNFTMQTDPSNTYGADSSNVNVQVTGASNTLTLNQATTALAATLDLDWIIQGSNNTITSSINIDGATNYMDIDGSDNSVTYTGTGVTASSGGYFHLDHTGSQRAFTINQLSTQNNDWLKIISSGGNASSTFCVNQNDQGTAVGC